MKTFIAAAVGVLVLAPAALAGDLVLAPTSYGAQTFASWRAQEGLPDTVGFANQALVLEKDVNDADTAAVAVIRGLEGARAQDIAGLEWEHRIPITDCNKTSPRWELVVQGKRQHTVSFGCAVSAHAPGSAPNWVRDVNTKTAIRARLLAAGKDVAAGQVVSLAIVFDQRAHSGVAVLDNIKVVAAGHGTNVWTSAADNAAVPLTQPAWTPRLDPFDDADFLTLDELWPSLPTDVQALASSDDEIVDA